jgi:hypothetical protein
MRVPKDKILTILPDCRCVTCGNIVTRISLCAIGDVCVIDDAISNDMTPRRTVWRLGRTGVSTMNWLRSALVLTALVASLMFSGIGLYSVNADGNVEQVVDGYAVVSPVK